MMPLSLADTDAFYPPQLRERLEGGAPQQLTVLGNLKTLALAKTALLCSARCPGNASLAAHDQAARWRDEGRCVIGEFHSPVEKECLRILLRGRQPVTLCPARGLEGMRLPADWKKPLAEGRLLLLSFFDDGIRRATANLAVRRNAYVAGLADRILIAHAGKGSKTEGLCREALARDKLVFTLDSPDNAHLVELGAVPVRADNPVPLTNPEVLR